ncbi:MAG TPA: CBS domain-containing protein [Gaiellaceae bacterium]|nr:CBS domain-containing protein [Gaiellaceae bacterium]
MKVNEIMTTDVLTIGPEAPLKDVARILVEREISGMPVCDIERHVLGVVSEADILFKERGRPSETSALVGWVLGGSVMPDAAKAAARTVDEAMTAPAITIGPFRSVHEAARLMTEHGINRLPVVRDDELVGIVTRTDLVRAFVRGDAEIHDEIVHELLGRTLWLDQDAVEAEVRDGSVLLTGEVRTRSDAALLERLVTRVPGVVAVDSKVHWRLDDTTRKGRQSLERTL